MTAASRIKIQRVSPGTVAANKTECRKRRAGLNPQGGLRPATFETLFGLIASAGLRVPEALLLFDTDADLSDGMLMVRQTKFAKSRLRTTGSVGLGGSRRPWQSSHPRSAPQLRCPIAFIISGCCGQLYILLILNSYPVKKVIVTMNDTKKACDLCGLAVETPGFTLKTKDGDKAFCCEGCKGIYHLFNEELILPESDQAKLFTI